MRKKKKEDKNVSDQVNNPKKGNLKKTPNKTEENPKPTIEEELSNERDKNLRLFAS